MLPYAARDFLSHPPPLKRAKVDPFGGDASATHSPSNNTTSSSNSRLGRWTPDEKLLFLHGLSIYGKGKWKKIRQFLPSRTLVQIKSHAQKVLKREADGEDVMAPLKTDKERLNKLLSKGEKQHKGPGGLSASLLTVAQKLKPKSPQMGVFDHIKASPNSHNGPQAPPKIIDRPMQMLADCSTASGAFRFRISENVPSMYGRYPQHHHEPIYSTRLGPPPPPPPPHHHMYYHDYHPHHHHQPRHPQHVSPHRHAPPPPPPHPHSPHRPYRHSGYHHRTHFSFPPAPPAPLQTTGSGEAAPLSTHPSPKEQPQVTAANRRDASSPEAAKTKAARPTATPPNEQVEAGCDDNTSTSNGSQNAAVETTVTGTPTTVVKTEDQQKDAAPAACVTPERRTKHVDIMAAAALCQLAKKRRRSDDLPYMVSP
uniref:HTH myb-type domain-containing protein n=1 Tax=Grammatophora oceanica TaxID=210454 RepID=A0A7S1Y5C3_9STRA|mmetsp:Transcript_30056/g.44373  ORF Transcript_30056/g.44373 Transcript_30056/m.44373 type:complete len:425 (+) Transcript_30056:81-1355(+)|eukprot:CAMPEP_0194031204 /NCGR_PEP_ID=MMETSP0009_2-20130614/4432_1 /TAXON_ID=210454 /ORGANISM="Grammatophora oceanica, Strain CCMP 410" /LENGTH=424 /DNA_ID=CAMNT_0038671289 /DNA_START=77 /DNA_END=1351 /DNA_ORIENTATION=-